MSDNLAKITKILLIVLMVITLFFIVRFYMVMPSLEAIDMGAGEFDTIENVITDDGGILSTDSSLDEKISAVKNLGYFFQWVYILLIVSAAGAVLFVVYHFVMQLIDKPKTAIFNLIPVAIFGILLLVAYSYASSDVLSMGAGYDGADNVPDTLKWVGTGMFTTYFLLGLSVLAIIYVEIAKIFK